MNQSLITVQGYVGNDPQLRSAAGHPVVGFRLACTPRRLNRSTGEWVDAPTQWYSVSAWRQLGLNVEASIKKGDPVVVYGRLLTRTFVNKSGVEVSSLELEALSVGHDLNRGRTTLTKNEPRPRAAGEPAGSLPPAPEDPLEQARADWGDPGEEESLERGRGAGTAA